MGGRRELACAKEARGGGVLVCVWVCVWGGYGVEGVGEEEEEPCLLTVNNRWERVWRKIVVVRVRIVLILSRVTLPREGGGGGFYKSSSSSSSSYSKLGNITQGKGVR